MSPPATSGTTTEPTTTPVVAGPSTVSPPKDAEQVADSIQPVIDAVGAVAPASDVEKVEVFLGKYAKGWVALVGTVATFALEYVPIDSTVAHVASGVFAAATVIGVVLKKNGI